MKKAIFSLGDCSKISPAERAAYLRRHMKAKGATAGEVASMIGYSVETVRGWLSKAGTQRHAEIPDRAFILLRMALSSLPDAKGDTPRRGRPI